MPSGGVADKWTLILEALTEKGVLRFTRLSELIEGVSQKMLTQTLRHMEHDGLIRTMQDICQDENHRVGATNDGLDRCEVHGISC